MNTKITVITPSYNQGDFLEETIESVLDQHYPNLEYMIIDGGSTDRSPEIIRKYARHLKYWVSERDSGQSEAINKGLKLATGEIISWLCSDDVYLPSTFTRVEEIFRQHPDAALLHGKTILFNTPGGPTREKGADPEGLRLKYFAIIPFPQPSSFFRKRVIAEQGLLDERLHFAMDYDLLIRIALHYPIVSVPDILSKYRLHESSKSVRSIPSFMEEWALVFSKFIRSVPELKNYVDDLRDAGLYRAGQDVYEHTHRFSPEDVRTILYFFLQNQLHGYYTVLDKSRVRRILHLIQQVLPDYYRSPECRMISFRNRFIPGPVLRLIRTIRNPSEQ